jgi:thiol:disulfide interchange protein DsbA
MKKLIITLLSVALFANIAFAETFVAGKDYTVLDPSAPKQKVVSVIEFFNYGCPWCSLVDPAVEKWRATKPAYVDFSRIPATFEQGWGAYAKAYYCAVAMNIEPKISPALFLAIHGADDQQNNDLSSPAAMVNFFVQHGVKRADAEAAFMKPSAALDAQVQSGEIMMKVYKIMYIPTFVVGEKYSVNLAQAQKPERFIAILRYLIELSHQKS